MGGVGVSVCVCVWVGRWFVGGGDGEGEEVAADLAVVGGMAEGEEEMWGRGFVEVEGGEVLEGVKEAERG
jgi:hypothetical protein